MFDRLPKPSAQSNASHKAIADGLDACSGVLRAWHSPSRVGVETRGGIAISAVLSRHHFEFEENIWGFYPDQEDLGEYDDMQLVGDVNHHDANNVNRTTTPFLVALSSEHLPNLLRDATGGSSTKIEPKYQPLGTYLVWLKDTMDKFAKLAEAVSSPEWMEAASTGLGDLNILQAGQPGLARRAGFLATGVTWEYPCLQELIFKSSDGDYYQSSRDSHRLRKWSRDKVSADYYAASVWRCIVAVRQMIEDNVIASVRQTQADVTEALDLYNMGVEGAGAKLQRQMRNLIAGRGWDIVETAEIGVTPAGHWYESSAAGAKSLGELQNVTIWRRMILPLDQGALDKLQAAGKKLGSL